MNTIETTLLLLLISFVFCFGQDTYSAELSGVLSPEKIVVDQTPLVLNGMGLRVKTVFQVKVYVVSLYLTKRSSDEAEILKSDALKQLDIVFLRDVSAADISKSWDEGLERNCSSHCERFNEKLNELKTSMTDVKDRQKVGFTFYRDKFKISVAGSQKEFKGREFADLILSNFIANGPSPEVKRGLLGLTGAARSLASVPYTEP